MSGSAEASPRSSPPDYHSLYVQARASHERTVYELRQRELELTGELNSKWCSCRNALAQRPHVHGLNHALTHDLSCCISIGRQPS
jgi:hypothetical protein